MTLLYWSDRTIPLYSLRTSSRLNGSVVGRVDLDSSLPTPGSTDGRFRTRGGAGGSGVGFSGCTSVCSLFTDNNIRWFKTPTMTVKTPLPRDCEGEYSHKQNRVHRSSLQNT